MGSSPTVSTKQLLFASVLELVDGADSKSVDEIIVWVRFPPLASFFKKYVAVAQLVEQRIFNPFVAGSNPVSSTKRTHQSILECA